MTSPKISICVPNLNTLPFLPERFETIFQQTFENWELLVYDSYSDDGAWDYISNLTKRESRMRAWQGPREGTPGSWSPCVSEAQGEYVYIATSDDTMPLDCLQKLQEALEENPECDLAHCNLRAIDLNGQDIAKYNDWWSQSSLFALSSGDLIDRPHVRKAPFDGLLHMLGGTVYVSITQLLIRRSLFDKIGLFESRWGSVGDFVWNMRAGLVANTVHVPETWGGWRLHPGQATEGAAIDSKEHSQRIDSMIHTATRDCKELLGPILKNRLFDSWLDLSHDLRTFDREVVRLGKNPLKRKAFVLRRLLAGSPAARKHLKSKFLGARLESGPELIRNWLGEVGMEPLLTPPGTGSHQLSKCS